ncbi:MAG: T9SS type A sorting domain-containing protein [candidate division Zixibacteria bacterium]|nr:T9SS type A sorting domain-containing protein [candidate division Zixibacteria bacterium]
MKIKKVLLAGILIPLLLCVSAYAGVAKISIDEAQRIEFGNGENLHFNKQKTLDISIDDYLEESPGIQVGTTSYEYQSNGSTGNRIYKHECGTHMAWMNGVGQWIGNRWIYYNFIDPDGNLSWQEGTPVSVEQGAGYCHLDVTEDGRPAIVYHNSSNSLVRLSVDESCGAGNFTLYDPPDSLPGESGFFWSYLTVDNTDRIHIISTENEPEAGALKKVTHTYSSDGGSSWGDLVIYDTLMDISSIITSSRISGKVAIVYTDPIDYEDPNQYNNDIAYIESPDGVTWDYDSPVNVTNYQYEDTIRAYTDVDAIYDFDDNLHIVWNAPGYWADEGTITIDACFLFHWSEETGTTMIYNAWHPSFPGKWCRSAAKMSISVDSLNNLYVLWTHFDSVDVSSGGWSNGELYASASSDGGASWIPPVNLTNTPTPGCQPGDCNNDHWSSLTEVSDDSMYIIYPEDKDAGSVTGAEGTETENPVRYLAVSTSELLPVGVDEEIDVPTGFALNQNYPNPFNASTNISFTLAENGHTRLEVYNLLGEKVETLIDEYLNAGEYGVNWEAGGNSTGVYFYRLKTEGVSKTRRMVLLK